MKRAFDIVASLIGLALLALPLAVLVIAVRRGSRGRGIFAQPRVGRQRKTFTCYKLRTMSADTPMAATHHTGAAQVTPLGRWLRRFKLDEIPQLWNVLRGDMSLVGPRPCLPIQHELIDARDAKGVFAARPGITGLAQVRGIDMSQPEKLAYVDAAYLANATFANDLKLIWRTVAGGGRGDRVAR